MSEANWNIFVLSNPAEAAYLESQHQGNSFLTSLFEQAVERGELSPRQLECVQQNMPKGEDEQAGNWARFTTEHPEVAEFLIAAKHDFMRSLFEQAKNKGQLSEKQLAAAERFMANNTQRNGQWSQDRAKPTTATYKGITGAFITLQRNGLQRPKLRFEGVSLSLAKDGSHIWVNGPERETWGRINLVDGIYWAAPGVPADVHQLLAEIDKDPMAASKKYGHASGSCGVCGRGLTNSVSIKMGIGPICAEKLGLDAARCAEEEKRDAMGAAEYLLEGADLTIVVEGDDEPPFPTPDYEPATLEDIQQCSAEEYERAKWGE